MSAASFVKLEKLPAPETIALEFASVLKRWSSEKWVTDKHGTGVWKKMLADNAAEGDDPTSCHSHDWCDANMAMDEAFKKLGVDHETQWGEEWAGSQEAADLWGAAWDFAFIHYLSGPKKAE